MNNDDLSLDQLAAEFISVFCPHLTTDNTTVIKVQDGSIQPVPPTIETALACNSIKAIKMASK
jgi:hypothetical protein